MKSKPFFCRFCELRQPAKKAVPGKRLLLGRSGMLKNHRHAVTPYVAAHGAGSPVTPRSSKKCFPRWFKSVIFDSKSPRVVNLAVRRRL